jgi:hypothetical protein
VCKKNGIKKTRFQNLCESFESLKTLSKMVWKWVYKTLKHKNVFNWYLNLLSKILELRK